ncbi:hypothetical protein M9458_016786, partial [Cirrhinus mrigala]
LLGVEGSRPGTLSPELPGAERSGERHTDEASATSVPWHPAPGELDESERTRGDIAMSPESQRGPPKRGQTFSKSASPPRDEASIPRASAPASTGCLLHVEMPRDMNCPQREEFVLGPQKDLVHQL